MDEPALGGGLFGSILGVWKVELLGPSWGASLRLEGPVFLVFWKDSWGCSFLFPGFLEVLFPASRSLFWGGLESFLLKFAAGNLLSGGGLSCGFSIFFLEEKRGEAGSPEDLYWGLLVFGLRIGGAIRWLLFYGELPFWGVLLAFRKAEGRGPRRVLSVFVRCLGESF